MTSVISTNGCAGWVLRRRQHEAFDADQKSLGLFDTEQEANRDRSCSREYRVQQAFTAARRFLVTVVVGKTARKSLGFNATLASVCWSNTVKNAISA